MKRKAPLRSQSADELGYASPEGLSLRRQRSAGESCNVHQREELLTLAGRTSFEEGEVRVTLAPQNFVEFGQKLFDRSSPTPITSRAHGIPPRRQPSPPTGLCAAE